MAKPRGTKLRAFIVSGVGPSVIPSQARTHKPPAKAISARKAAPSRRANVPAPDPGARRDKEARPAPRR